MKTTLFIRLKFFLLFFSIFFAKLMLYSQEVPHTPYPIIFIHGLSGASSTWMKENYFDIIDFLQSGDTPLKFGGILKITLDHDRNQTKLNSPKEDDVFMFNNPDLTNGYLCC
jgi:pimeloyl-ACP methyl ester carboxylesterase